MRASDWLKINTRRVLRVPARAFLRNKRTQFGKHSIAHLFVRGQFPDTQIVSPTTFGSSIRCDLNDMIMQRIHFFGVWEPNETEWLRSRLKPGDVLVDVGAHAGYYTILAADRVGATGRVVAVEPSPGRMTALKDNVALNRHANVRFVQAAITNVPGTVTLYNSYNAASATTMGDDGYGVEAVVQSLPLIDVLSEDEIAKTRILKIDIEGREYDAITSFAPALGKMRPDFELVVELTPRHLATQGRTARNVLDLMLPFDFEPMWLQNDYSTDSYVEYSATGHWERPTKLSHDDPWWDDPTGGQRDIIFTRAS